MSEEIITTDLSVEDAKKQANKDRMAKARAARGKKKTSVQAGSIKVKDPEIVWFTEVDYNDKGGVAADFPAYYFDTKELKEDIRNLSEQLGDGIFTGKRKRENEERLAVMKGKLEKIEKGKPKLSGPTKDKVADANREIGEEIKESMFSYDSHWKQTADPHIVAERMVTPCIDIKNNPVIASFMKQRGFQIVNGKVNRVAADIFHKVTSKLLEEDSDVSRLQPVRAHGNVI